MTSDYLIQHLGLQPLPGEGGWFTQTWLSAQRSPNGRAAGTAIYFLINETNFSALHRLSTDEIYHFYAGDPVEQLQLWPNGSTHVVKLGSDFAAGQQPQAVAPAGAWQGSRLTPRSMRGPSPQGWALMGTTMAPGFDEKEFELGQRADLIKRYPASRDHIEQLTRQR